MPPANPFSFSALLERVRAVLPPGKPVYLVGGAVRDALLSRPTHDLDFVLSRDVMGISRRVANRLGGAFYPLDQERETARVILIRPDGSRDVLDFAAIRGPDLEADLRARDFTINAMAVAVHEHHNLIDPLGGATDLRQGWLRSCSSTTFQDDPLRIVRAVRLATAFSFRIAPETLRLMRQGVEGLIRISPERMRDELFRILGGTQPAAALRALDILGALPYILPELVAMKRVTQPPPHISDVWTHTLSVVQKLEDLLAVLAPELDPDAVASMAMGQVSLRLGRYRAQVHTHLQVPFTPDRSLRMLLFMSALYHDAGKPQTLQLDEKGRLHFYGHERVGAEMVAERARLLRLSNDETERLQGIVYNHMRPLLLAQSGERPTRRAIYRFFRDTGPAGVDICLLSLADTMATYGHTLPQEVWANQLGVVRALLEAWWERPDEDVSPPALLNGHDIMKAFNLEPGPQIGRLLEVIREAQATGRVKNREQALSLVREHLKTLH